MVSKLDDLYHTLAQATCGSLSNQDKAIIRVPAIIDSVEERRLNNVLAKAGLGHLFGAFRNEKVSSNSWSV